MGIVVAVGLSACSGPAPSVVSERDLRALHDEAEAALLAATTGLSAELARAGADWQALPQDVVPVETCLDGTDVVEDAGWAQTTGSVVWLLEDAVAGLPGLVTEALVAATPSWVDGTDWPLDGTLLQGTGGLIRTDPTGDLALGVDTTGAEGGRAVVTLSVLSACTRSEVSMLVDDVEADGWTADLPALTEAAGGRATP